MTKGAGEDDKINVKSIFLKKSMSKKRHPKYIKGGTSTNDVKLAEKIYLNIALKLILLSKETIITRLKNMSIDIIKQIFIKNAYTWALNHAKPINVADNDVNKNIQNQILNDPFCEYTYVVKRISKAYGGDKYAPYKMDDIKAILNRTEDEINNDMKDDISPFDTIQPPSKWSINKGRKDEKFNIMFNQYTHESYMSFLEYQKNNLFQKSFVPRHIQFTEYLEKWKPLYELEQEILKYSRKIKIRPNIKIELLNNIRSKYNNFSPEKINLSQHFCPTGENHKIGSYIYSDGKKEYEFTQKEIVGWLEKRNEEKLNLYDNLKLVDEKCERCKNLIRNIKSSDKNDESLSVVFKKIDDILAFYQYFETRCPKNNLHEFQNNTCSKCGMQTDYVKKNNEEYYSKYLSVFNQIQLKKQSIAINSLNLIKQENENKYKEERENKVEYKYSLKNTAEWSQITETKYNIIANIGLFEGYKYEDIENSKVNPSKNDNITSNRAIKLKGYIYDLLRKYNVVLGHDKIVDLPLEIKELLDSQKKIEIKNLQESLPKLDDFNELDNKYKNKLSLTDYINFLQEYLASIIVRISKESESKYKILSSGLVKYFTNIILSNEKLFSVPEYILANKVDISTLEDESDQDVNGVSEDEWADKVSEYSAEPRADEEDEVETYDNGLDNDGYDVENERDVWEGDD